MRAIVLLMVFVLPLSVAVTGVAAVGPPESVAGTLHNLSVSGPGEVRSLTEPEICKFCHIPHRTVGEKPLWGHALSQVKQYVTPTLRRGNSRSRPAPQPDGSSRLCLSCHDGTVALGEIVGQPPIPMAVNRLGPGRRSHLGTDLSGSHPVSFAYPDARTRDDGTDMGLRPPSGDSAVRLDAGGKMQCTTCHDPHSDRHHQPGKVPRFWVAPTVTEVCLTCHELR